MPEPRTRFTSPACGGARIASTDAMPVGENSLRSNSLNRGGTPTPALPRRRERERISAWIGSNIGREIDQFAEQNAGFRQHLLDIVGGLGYRTAGGIERQFGARRELVV